jgi:O-antigen ligase
MNIRKDDGRTVLWGYGLLLVVLLFAPLVRGGNRPLALLALELASLGLLLAVVMKPVFVQRVSWAGGLFIGGLVALPLMHLIPLPFDVWSGLPGRAPYAEVLAVAGEVPDWLPVSIVPYATEQSLLTLLPPLAVALLVLSLGSTEVKRLVAVFLGVVVFQAVLGLMQYGSGGDSPLYLGLEISGGSGVGTYANRNHLAGLMEMALPIALALLAASIFGLDRATSRRHISRRAGLFTKFSRWFGSEVLMNRTFLLTAICLAIVLGAVFSRSRTGIGLLIVGLVLTAIVLMRNFGGGFARRVVGAITALGFVLAMAVGLVPVFDRFGVDPLTDARWPILDSTIKAAGVFFPLGSGMGTYPEVMRAFQPDEVGKFVNHAHSDFAEWWMEGGIIALGLMLLFAVLYAVRWRALWAERNWHAMHMMQVGAGVGIFLILLHGLTDYNLRIPANMIYFAFLAAVFFHPGEALEHHGHKHGRHKHNDAEPEATAPPEVAPVATVAPVTSQPAANLFAEPAKTPEASVIAPTPRATVEETVVAPAPAAPTKRNPFDENG